MKIIYGTANIGKKKQVEDFFKATNIDVEIVSLKDIGFDKEIIEDGTTFEENSMIKAKAIQSFCKENNIEGIIVTDDTGLCVDCLNGEPGIYSARYAGDHAPQEVAIEKLLTNIEKTGDKERKAKFVCVLTAVLPNGEMKQVRGECLGTIAKTPGSMGKLTYGPVFIPEGFDRVMNELKDEELGSTHREKAFLELLKIICPDNA
jgi:XTP/dITP diphosphohydrolase